MTPPCPSERHVWIVRREVMYAEGEHLGVYATAEAAMAAHAPPDPLPLWCTAWRQARAGLSEANPGELLDWYWRDDGGDTINAERHQVHSAAPEPGGDSDGTTQPADV